MGNKTSELVSYKLPFFTYIFGNSQSRLGYHIGLASDVAVDGETSAEEGSHVRAERQRGMCLSSYIWSFLRKPPLFNIMQSNDSNILLLDTIIRIICIPHPFTWPLGIKPPTHWCFRRH